MPTLQCDDLEMECASQEKMPLRHDLKLWAEGLLSDELLDKNKYLNKKVVQKMWSEHLMRESDFGQQIWTILIFQSWMYGH